MANVLPLNAQKKIWRIYRSRFIITASLLLLGVASLAFASLVPSYLALELAAPVTPPLPPKSKTAGADDPTALARAQTIVRELTPLVTASSTASGAITTALANRPEGVTVDRISYRAADGAQPGQLMLGGSAPREAVSAYRSRLAADKYFKTISVPVGALVGAEGGRFSITLEGQF